MTAARRGGKLVGYIRVSSMDQSELRQLDGVSLDKRFTDTASGKDTKRPQLQAALEYLRDGDPTLSQLKADGYRTIVIQPVGFLCDHVEVLYDIDIAFQQTATNLGLTLICAESLNDSSLLIDALEDLALYGRDDSTFLSRNASSPSLNNLTA